MAKCDWLTDGSCDSVRRCDWLTAGGPLAPVDLCPYVYKYICTGQMLPRIAQELCESRGGRPGLSVLTNPLVFRGRKDLLNRASALVTTCP